MSVEPRFVGERSFPELTDGRCAHLEAAEITLWIRAAGPESLPDVAAFERLDRTLHELSNEGLDGEFEAKAFRVVTDTAPERDIGMRIDVDPRRDVLRVAVVGTREPGNGMDGNEPMTIFGVVPKA